MKERGSNFLKALDKFAGIPLLRICGSRSIKAPLCSSSHAKNVGILCLGAIGDLLLAGGLINGIALSLPKACIEIISSKANSGALALFGDNFVKSAFPVSNFFKLLRHIRKRDYDLFIDTTQWARLGALLSRFSGAKITVGFETPGQARGNGYDIKVPHLAFVHETQNFASLGKALFKNFNFLPGLVIPEKFINPFAADEIAILHFWPANGPGRELKMWPESYWAKLAGNLLQRGFRILLTGSKKDAQGSEKFIEKFFGGEEHITSIAGKYTLAELASILSKARALVSVNTGIMHLGAILGTPTLGLHGATDPLRWGPKGLKTASLLPQKGHYAYLNLGFEYPAGVLPAMQWISVTDVLNALDKLLGTEPG